MNFIVMGVAGSGKSTVAKALAKQLNCDFLEGDIYHPEGNVVRMKEGRALTDEDRSPWLEALTALIDSKQSLKQPFVLACSALKKSYRDQLSASGEPLLFIFLQGDRQKITERMQGRDNHFMSMTLINSQFEALEEPSSEEFAITLSINNSITQILDQITTELELLKH